MTERQFRVCMAGNVSIMFVLAVCLMMEWPYRWVMLLGIVWTLYWLRRTA